MDIISLNPDLGLFLLRLAIGAVYLAHGPSKFTDTARKSQGMGIPTNLLLVVAALETFGAVAMILGSFTQLASLGIIAVMLGAIYMKTQKWGKKFTGDGGWELDFILIAAALAILFIGPGSYTL